MFIFFQGREGASESPRSSHFRSTIAKSTCLHTSAVGAGVAGVAGPRAVEGLVSAGPTSSHNPPIHRPAGGPLLDPRALPTWPARGRADKTTLPLWKT